MSGEDPASMRHVAHRLRALADEIHGHTQRVAGAARGIEFEGPAGETFRQVAARSATGVDVETQRLRHLAARLESAATEIEWQRHAERGGL